ncbi:MAG TPA: thioredoxin family protein [Verrucomicrobiae bacterium]|nr:thioredoxin family protein [Verrucomicrobiae bacterium]
MRATLAVLLLASGCLAQAAEPVAGDPFEQGLAQARARRVPVLVDFHAPWCYSCYYMAKNVLSGPDWERVQREAVVVELDADSPVGARWMAAWGVKAMPTYLVFNADGQELGRILGEQTRDDFYPWLARTTASANPLDALKAKAVDGTPAAVAAAREVLRAHHARYDADGGLDWYASLPSHAKAAVAGDAEGAAWVARLELQRAAAKKDVPACLTAAPKVLAASLGCERPYELAKVMACTDGQPQRRELLKPQAEPMQRLVDKRVLAGSRCADERSIVTGTADLYAALGDAPAEQRTLDRAINDVKQRLGKDFRKDRSLADNLRVYLDRAGRIDELDALLPKLIAAYPEDYVYAYRHAKSLAVRGKHAEALPFFELAAVRAYGVNKLRNAELRAKSLQALGRVDDARKVLTEALQANGPWFPDDAAKLKALLAPPAPAG